MRVFISHSMSEGDRDHFENLTAMLEEAKIAFFDPKSMNGSEALRDQLLNALRACDLCVFIFTERSVTRPWCLYEIGAFWGRGRPVIVYQTRPELDEKLLPELLQGLVRFHNIKTLISDVRGARERSRDDKKAPDAGPTLPIAMLPDLMEKVLDKLDARARAIGEDGRTPAVTRTATLRAAAELTGASDRVLWIDQLDHNEWEVRQLRRKGFLVEEVGSIAQAEQRLEETAFAATVAVSPEGEQLLGTYALADVPLFTFRGGRSKASHEKARASGARGGTDDFNELRVMLADLSAPTD